MMIYCYIKKELIKSSNATYFIVKNRRPNEAGNYQFTFTFHTVDTGAYQRLKNCPITRTNKHFLINESTFIAQCQHLGYDLDTDPIKENPFTISEDQLHPHLIGALDDGQYINFPKYDIHQDPIILNRMQITSDRNNSDFPSLELGDLARSFDIYDVTFTDCNIVSNLPNSSIQYSRINNSQFHQSLTGLKIKNTELNTCQFRYGGMETIHNSSHISNTNFTNCNLKSSLWINSHIMNTSFIDCDFKNSEFSRAIFNNVSFKGTNLQNVKFSCCFFYENCDFSQALNAESVLLDFLKEAYTATYDAYNYTSDEKYSAIMRSETLKELLDHALKKQTTNLIHPTATTESGNKILKILNKNPLVSFLKDMVKPGCKKLSYRELRLYAGDEKAQRFYQTSAPTMKEMEKYYKKDWKIDPESRF